MLTDITNDYNDFIVQVKDAEIKPSSSHLYNIISNSPHRRCCFYTGLSGRVLKITNTILQSWDFRLRGF